MRLAFIVATDLDGVIGRDGALPWRLPADLAHFKRTTMGRPIIMGRKTCQSIGRALPGRQNIGLTRDATFAANGFDVAHTIDAAVTLADDRSGDEVFVIGGGEVYALFLDRCDRIYRTVVDCRVDGDTHFPALADDEWSIVSTESHDADPKNEHGYRFEVLDRLRWPETTD